MTCEQVGTSSTIPPPLEFGLNKWGPRIGCRRSVFSLLQGKRRDSMFSLPAMLQLSLVPSSGGSDIGHSVVCS